MGCRGAVEALLKQLADGSGSAAARVGLFSVAMDRSVTMQNALFSDPALLSDVLHQGASEETEMWVTGRTSSKAQRTKRCPLHSLKPRAVGPWSEIWQFMNTDCQTFLLAGLNAAQFEEALQIYLRKHKFCSHCRSVVLDAFDMLIGECLSGSVRFICSPPQRSRRVAITRVMHRHTFAGFLFNHR